MSTLQKLTEQPRLNNLMPVKIEKTDWQTSSEILSKIRFEVFVDEQQVPAELEIDEQDPLAIHFIATDEQSGEAVGTARLLGDGHVGRMAVLKNWRGRGIGHKILQQVFQEARNLGFKQLLLNAQVYAKDFYRGAGFVEQGEIFLDAGIDHIKMTRKLD
jgi:predicted GNAT family N-acyltransferase